MLADAITLLKAGVEEPQEEVWSPTIAIGAPVTIPEDYVADLTLRLQLYRRLSTLETDQDIEAFAAEMIDRFGPIPPEVEQLFEIVAIKALCRRAHVEKIDAGPKGVIVAFREDKFANPAGLVRYVAEHGNERQGASRHAHRFHSRIRQHETASRRRAPHSSHAGRNCGEEGRLTSRAALPWRRAFFRCCETSLRQNGATIIVENTTRKNSIVCARRPRASRRLLGVVGGSYSNHQGEETWLISFFSSPPSLRQRP